MQSTIAFIGAGNMAQALIGGLLHNGHPAEALVAADPSADTRELVERRFGIQTRISNPDAVASADAVVLAIKPQSMDLVLQDLQGSIQPGAVVISVAAGVPVARIRDRLGDDIAIVRAMPNTPALIGIGATGLFADAHCSAEQRALATAIFSAVGEVAMIEDETLMDAVTAVSGSGPAYFFALTEALSLAGIRAGLSEDTARLLARQTAAGAGAMLGQDGADAAVLRKQVTSPGGTTAAALEAFAGRGFNTIVNDAVSAAVERGQALGASFNPGNTS